jgi:hypothetical protein
MAVFPVHGSWHLRRLCNRIWVRLVVLVLLRGTADHILSAGMLLVVIDLFAGLHKYHIVPLPSVFEPLPRNWL